ncbi:MAG TPA: serine/threonine-protein kinase, partial [Rhodanobacteraceae bacterium]|nr:serine/threonine-protein kinase [Rhodanobacteraceae bacterium]
MTTLTSADTHAADTLRWDAGVAALVFGSTGREAPDLSQLRHLALLPVDALELDLADPAQRRFGDYELLELIGEGGMGVVYRARQASLDREVAIKLLAAGPWASKEFIERFRREAQNAARMQHPNIVAIYEVGDAEELHFFSMRLVHGGSLAALLERERGLEPQRAAQLLRTIAEAVAYAHSLAVLHLDLKPANVLLDNDGTPHVADFGLARRLDSALAVDNEEISGTPAYMAPEQAEVRTQKISAATDIWGLGAILYELVTGQPPFRAGTVHEVLRLVREGQVISPRRYAPKLPRDLEAIVLKCLARDPGARYATARDLADDLGRFLAGYQVRARPLGTSQRFAWWVRRQPYVAAFAALFAISLIAGIVGVSLQWRRANANAELAQATLWKSRTDTAQKQIEQGDAYPALENAFANLREMEAQGDRDDAALERLRIGTALANAPRLIDAIRLGTGKQITALAISTDGKSVAAVTNARTIRLIDVASGRQRCQVEATPDSFGMTEFALNEGYLELHFSDDGQRLIGHTVAVGPASGDNPMLYPHDIDGILIDASTC